MEPQAFDPTYFYWIMGFMICANLGTLVSLIVYIIKFAHTFGVLQTTVSQLTKATDKLEKDVNEAHRKIRGGDGRC